MVAARRTRAAHRSASARSTQPVRREQRSATSAPSAAVPRLHRPDYQIILWVGLLMLLAKGLAAVVLWPLGTLTAILGVTLVWATLSAQRATRRLTRQMSLQGP